MKAYILGCMLPAIATYLLFKYVKNIKIAIAILVLTFVGGLFSLLSKPLEPVVYKLSDQQFDFDNIGKGGVFARADTCIYIIAGEDMPYVIVDEEDSTVFLTKEIVGDYIKPYAKKDKKRCVITPNEEPWKLYYDGVFSGSYFETTMIERSSKQLLKNIPEALENVFLRPYPNDPPPSKFKYVTILDSWGILGLFLTVVFFYRRKIQRNELNLIVSLMVFSIVLALLIGWTTPVFGAIVRYKVPIQLAMMISVLILVKPIKIFKK